MTDDTRVAELIAQIGLKHDKCNKCYGRGHKGYNLTYKRFLACQCLKKSRIMSEKVDTPEVKELLGLLC